MSLPNLFSMSVFISYLDPAVYLSFFLILSISLLLDSSWGLIIYEIGSFSQQGQLLRISLLHW